MNYTLSLTRQQVEFLMETIEAFVDNKKLLHLPDKQGEIISLPLTEEAMKFLHAQFGPSDEGKKEFLVVMEKAEGGTAKLRIEFEDSHLEYVVDLDEFDSQ